MKNRKRTVKNPAKNLIIKCFLKAPIPMSITRAKDGTYVEVNESAVKYMGLKREDIIGRKSSELGHFPTDQRHLFVDAIKKQGFAKDIPLELNIENNGVLHMLFNVYPIKMGKETFFLSFASDISNREPTMKKFHDDRFFKMTLQDHKFIKGKLKQYPLTPRQQEITVLSAAGDSNVEISRKLFISTYTVKKHLKEIFKIIGIHNRSELFPKLLNIR
jgi:PAS domain S-box-containing protein